MSLGAELVGAGALTGALLLLSAAAGAGLGAGVLLGGVVGVTSASLFGAATLMTGLAGVGGLLVLVGGGGLTLGSGVGTENGVEAGTKLT